MNADVHTRAPLLFLALIAALWCIPAAAQTDPPGLADHAQRILVERCIECHGPDRQEGGLRLDSRAALLAGGDSPFGVVALGNAEDSLLIELITATDPDDRMPQENTPLPPQEIAVLTEWIDAGAPWPGVSATTSNTGKHWSFVPLQRPPLPDVPNTSAARNPIDAFILSELESQGLRPMPEADRYSLIRRAYLETIGLPPSPGEVSALVNDPDPGAYERLVDRLLDSPHYGERQAQRWLDAARYADTNGYEKDRPRSIWPYRDWVIEAYNENLPYDQFIIEQLAGDLLPNATESQRIATGFHRNTMLNEEGGIDAAEDWYKRTVDRTNTTATAFLGLTMTCAQCHTHKYDPITQTEYFQFAAFFNDAQEATLRVSDETIAAERAAIQNQIDLMNHWIRWLGSRDGAVQAEYAAWREETARKARNWHVARPVAMQSLQGADLWIQNDDSVLVSGDLPNDDVYVLEFELPSEPITAMRLEVLPHPSLPGGGPGRGTILAEGDFLLTELKVYKVDEDRRAAPVTIAAASEDYAREEYEAAKALDGLPDTGWSVKDATGKAHQTVFAFDGPVPVDGSRLRVEIEQDFIHQHTIGRFRISFTSDSGEIVAAGVPSGIETILLNGEEDDSAVKNYFLLNVAEGLKDWHERRDDLVGSMPQYATTLVMTERARPRETHVYTRGEFGREAGAIEPGVPDVLPELDDAPRDRLALARWIASGENPLTARVAMNRMWQGAFGRGLVNTPEDFGLRGERPSHPKLLDWLAVEFVERNWDWKAMHRLILTSAAFRRSSAVHEDLIERDPENIYLARGPRFRLDAEVLRDLALTASGLLNPEVGGPSVYPPQPDGVTELSYGEPEWDTSTGADRYRRGLYTYTKRTAPYAMEATFDAPTPEVTCVRRRRSNTPLQALTLLNDTVFVEAAEALGHRALDYGGDVSATIDHLFLHCLSRPADDIEREQVAAFYNESLHRFAEDPQRARMVSGPLGWFEPQQIDELAAWIAVARVILNLDETVMQG